MEHKLTLSLLDSLIPIGLTQGPPGSRRQRVKKRENVGLLTRNRIRNVKTEIHPVYQEDEHDEPSDTSIAVQKGKFNE